MKPVSPTNSSFAILALCFCQSCIIVSESTTTYIQCNEHLIEGHAKAEEGDWKQAARIWSQLASSGNSSACGKAAYNMVVACEMLGQRDLAIQWAQRTILQYKSILAKKRALYYLQILDEYGYPSEELTAATGKN